MSQDPEFPVRIFTVESEPPNDTLDDEPVEPDRLVDRPTVESVREAFAAFALETVEPASLATLSDLDRERLAYVRQHWLDLPEEVRIAIVSGSTDLSEDSVELNFARLLKHALGDPSPNVRQFAVLGLSTYDDIDSAQILLDHFQHDDSEDVRAEAAIALANWAEILDPTSPADLQVFRQIWNTLVRYAMSAAEPFHVRARAMESASRYEVDQRVENLIDEFYAEEETGLRLSAIVAMGNSANRRWIPLLVSELDSEDNEVRRAAADSLGQIGDPATIPDLRKATRDTDLEARHAAIWALGSISGPAAQRILNELAANPLPEDVQVIEIARSLDLDPDDEDEDDDPERLPFL
jgi:HEAT repeat protein